MNRILFEKDEIHAGEAVLRDVRAEHVRTVLHGEVGQTLKTGEVNGLVGTSEILRIESDGAVVVRCHHTEKSLASWIDVILAPPRPRVLKRLLPQLATLGVGRLILVGAQKVEKDFWGATLLKESIYRPLLVDGLMQAGTSTLPILEVRRNFQKFLRTELEALLPSPRRIVAHPYGAKNVVPPPLRSISTGGDGNRLTLAIGPEGGWTDAEVEVLEEHRFARYSLGPRILRTDTAAIALLAQLMMKEEAA